MPVGPNSTPTALMISVQCTESVQVHANASVTSPGPPSASMKAMIIMIPPVQVPVAAHLHPASTSPALQNPQAIQVPSNSPSATGEPSRCPVIVVAPVQVPVRTHASPVTLVIPVERSQTILVHTNTPEPSPAPLSPAVKAMVVMIASPQMPVSADLDPARTSPALLNPQPVQMTAKTSECTPTPAIWFVVFIVPPLVPV